MNEHTINELPVGLEGKTPKPNGYTTIPMYFFCSLICVVLSSCFKDGHHTYQGRILSYGTLVPVEGAVVSIIAGKTVGVLEPAQEWVIDSAKTDASGRFKISVSEGDYHRIGKIRKEGYFSDLPSQVTSLFSSGTLSNRDYIIDPMGILHVVIENDINVEGDYIEYRLPGKGSTKSTFETIEEIYFLRAKRVYTYSYKIDLNKYVYDSIFCKPFDTTYLHLKF